MAQLHADAVVGSFDLRGLSVSDETSVPELPEVKFRFRSLPYDGFSYEEKENWTFVLNKQSQALLEDIIRNFTKNVHASSYEEVAQLLHDEVERVFASKPEALAIYNEHDFTLEDVAVEFRGQDYHSRTPLSLPKDVFERAVQFTHTHHDEIGPIGDRHTHDVAVKLSTSVDASSIYGASERLENIIDDFFSPDKNYDKTVLEDAGTQLFNRITREVPEVPLWAVSLKIDYDGSLDHPTQTVDFVMSRN